MSEALRDFHNSSSASTFYVALYLYFLVWRATRPINKAVKELIKANSLHTQSLAQAQVKIDGHEKILQDHGNRLDGHEKRIVGLEKKPMEVLK